MQGGSEVISDLTKLTLDKEARYEAIKELIQAKNINLTTDLSDSDIAAFVYMGALDRYIMDTYLTDEQRTKLGIDKEEFAISLNGIIKSLYMQYRIPRNRQRALEYLKAIIGAERKPEGIIERFTHRSL